MLKNNKYMKTWHHVRISTDVKQVDVHLEIHHILAFETDVQLCVLQFTFRWNVEKKILQVITYAALVIITSSMRFLILQMIWAACLLFL